MKILRGATGFVDAIFWSPRLVLFANRVRVEGIGRPDRNVTPDRNRLDPGPLKEQAIDHFIRPSEP